MSEFSVIIPTLQRAKELHELVEQCAAHPRVLEVLVINNAPEPLAWDSTKVRVLQQAENIYVNPAWNLGAREARGKYLAILNDDITIEGEVFDLAARLLRRPWVGMVGFDLLTQGPQRVRVATEAHFPRGYGVFMAMRRGDYTPVPEDLLIWGGDNLLFWTARGLPLVVMGAPVQTEMNTTSSAPEFQAMRVREFHAANAHIDPVLYKRWWHRPVRGLHQARKLRGRLRSRA